MQKGKVKKNDKDFSIVIVPHFSGKVKTLKITKLYSGIILGIAALLIGTTVFGFTYGASKANENQQLKSNVSKLVNVNMAQQDVLATKNSKIKSLKTIDSKVVKIQRDFLSKYRSMTNNFLTNRSDSIGINGSGVSKDRAFVENLKQLKKMIVELKKLSDNDVKTASTIKSVEGKINSYLSCLPTSWPANGGVTSGFGVRSDPISYGYDFHNGVDIATSYGAGISAPGAGTVTSSGYDSSYGLKIVISHGYGFSTFYAHCSKSYVSAGQKVKRGQLIGLVGTSGRSTGPHLHFCVLINGSFVNPLNFLN
jgi:murein DD-endopeptidase MepM/ murein hydrolase activator NlpD